MFTNLREINELRVSIGHTPATWIMGSEHVIHGCFIPETCNTWQTPGALTAGLVTEKLLLQLIAARPLGEQAAM